MVLKPDETVRLYTHPQNLNKAVKRQHYQLKTAMEVIAKMPGSIPYVKALSHQSNVITAFPQRPKYCRLPRCALCSRCSIV